MPRKVEIAELVRVQMKLSKELVAAIEEASRTRDADRTAYIEYSLRRNRPIQAALRRLGLKWKRRPKPGRIPGANDNDSVE